jgi:hypothetical protein
MTDILSDPAALALYLTASLEPILAGNPGWRLAASVLFDRRN